MNQKLDNIIDRIEAAQAEKLNKVADLEGKIRALERSGYEDNEADLHILRADLEALQASKPFTEKEAKSIEKQLRQEIQREEAAALGTIRAHIMSIRSLLAGLYQNFERADNALIYFLGDVMKDDRLLMTFQDGRPRPVNKCACSLEKMTIRRDALNLLENAFYSAEFGEPYSPKDATGKHRNISG